jgi:hypothetical protein
VYYCFTADALSLGINDAGHLQQPDLYCT